MFIRQLSYLSALAREKHFTNDFLVFGTVATASFFAGSLLQSSGWDTINRLVLPIVALVLVPLLWRAARPTKFGLMPQERGP